jgi:hypothetical protein
MIEGTRKCFTKIFSVNKVFDYDWEVKEAQDFGNYFQ